MDFQWIQQRLQTASFVNSEEAVLINELIPSLTPLVQDLQPLQVDLDTHEVCLIIKLHQVNLNQICHAVGEFFKLICTEHNPLIFIVDDLQWADVASLELLKRLVMNSLI
jgi:predicted ATPase